MFLAQCSSWAFPPTHNLHSPSYIRCIMAAPHTSRKRNKTASSWTASSVLGKLPAQRTGKAPFAPPFKGFKTQQTHDNKIVPRQVLDQGISTSPITSVFSAVVVR